MAYVGVLGSLIEYVFCLFVSCLSSMLKEIRDQADGDISKIAWVITNGVIGKGSLGIRQQWAS